MVSTKVSLFMDGDQWCALMGDREKTNIQESPCGFGPTAGEALAKLGIELMAGYARRSAKEPRVAEENTTGKGCNCVACQTDGPHASDCAVHNEPAEPKGECDCGRKPVAA